MICIYSIIWCPSLNILTLSIILAIQRSSEDIGKKLSAIEKLASEFAMHRVKSTPARTYSRNSSASVPDKTRYLSYRACISVMLSGDESR